MRIHGLLWERALSRRATLLVAACAILLAPAIGLGAERQWSTHGVTVAREENPWLGTWMEIRDPTTGDRAGEFYLSAGGLSRRATEGGSPEEGSLALWCPAGSAGACEWAEANLEIAFHRPSDPYAPASAHIGGTLNGMPVSLDVDVDGIRFFRYEEGWAVWISSGRFIEWRLLAVGEMRRVLDWSGTVGEFVVAPPRAVEFPQLVVHGALYQSLAFYEP